jgi:hypothetical protein
MRFALFLISGLMFAMPTYGAVAIGIQTSTHSHFFNSATEVDGIAKVGSYSKPGGVETWTIHGLKPTDVGKIFTLDEGNAASYGFDFNYANIYWNADPFLSAGTVIDTDTHVEEWANQFHRIKGPLQNVQFRIISWTDTPNPPAPGYKTLVVETRVHYTVPEPASVCLAVFGVCGAMSIRKRW